MTQECCCSYCPDWQLWKRQDVALSLKLVVACYLPICLMLGLTKQGGMRATWCLPGQAGILHQLDPSVDEPVLLQKWRWPLELTAVPLICFRLRELAAVHQTQIVQPQLSVAPLTHCLQR